jgi:hypothetical protein
MTNTHLKFCSLLAIVLLAANLHVGMSQSRAYDDEEFGPVVRAYLGYLRNEQEVVDDRVSRREVSPVYYRRNSNRIRALREMAVRIARESRNDYLPELEAVTRDELGLLFEKPPQMQSLHAGELVRGTFRFLGPVRSSEVFYLFARLDPYEQSDLLQSRPPQIRPDAPSVAGSVAEPPGTSRSRRVTPP